MKLYRLIKNYAYQAINFVDDRYQDLSCKIDGKKSIKDEWDIANIKFLDTKLKTIKDFSSLTYSKPVFSSKAIEILKDFFISGEFLRMKSVKGKELFLYNIFPEIDCLDIDNSNLEWNKVRASILYDSKPTFIESKVDREILRIKYIAGEIFVTDKFVNRVLEHNLKGFQFIPVWDSESGYIEDIKGNRILT